MSVNLLKIIEIHLLNEKNLAETNIEYFLLDEKTSPEDKKNKILNELDRLKDSSLKLTFWNDFVSKKIQISEEINNNN